MYRVEFLEMGNRAAKVSEERKEEDDEDSKEKEIVISSPSSTHEEVRAGCVYGMGNGTKGQLGSQGTTCSPPQIIADGDLDSQCVVAVSGGHHMSAVLTDEGYVYVWGASGLSKESLHETSEEIEAREEVDHMIILSGKDSGETKHDRKLSKSVPRRVIMPSSHIRISCVSAAGKHVLAVSTDGHIFSWGEGKNGTLGHGNRRDVNIPMGIKYLEPHFIANCSTGVQHSACVTLDGSVFLWGFGLYVFFLFFSLSTYDNERMHTTTDTDNSEHLREKIHYFLECVNFFHLKRLQRLLLWNW
jgi:alpha-tubulin suppressor-like RCC1 family protein